MQVVQVEQKNLFFCISYLFQLRAFDIMPSLSKLGVALVGLNGSWLNNLEHRWNKMYEILLVIYLLAALGVVLLVLVQQGKGADMGASFGAGASNTVFGSGGSGNFLTRMTAIFAAIFLILSLVLGNMNAKQVELGSEYDDLSVPLLEQLQIGEESVVEGNDIPN